MRERCLIEFDKSGAEWVVVAYCSGDARMIDICERGVSPHPITGNFITGVPIELIEKEAKKDYVGMMNDPVEIERVRREKLPELFEKDYVLPRNMSIRQCGKKANHGLNYMESWSMFAMINELDAADAKTIVHGYSHVAYPGILVWWESVKRQLKIDRTLTNCFGDKRRFMEQWGNDLFKQAVAYIPQSTVAQLVATGMRLVYADRTISNDWDLLANVYDSLTFQVTFTDWKVLARQCIKVGLDYMNQRCSYGGRDFFIGTDLKIGRSWGAMTEVKLTKDVGKLAKDLRIAWGKHRGETAAAA